MRNLNVLVGHAALVVAKHDEFIYTDFGRYITPKGYGRARSAKTDPKLKIHTKPLWDHAGKLLNYNELFLEMEGNAKATHGENEMYASIIYGVDVQKALDYIDQIQSKGYIPYSGMRKNDSNCARFVTNTLLQALPKEVPAYLRLSKPVTIAPTPFFNVVASNDQGKYVVFYNGKATEYQDDYKVSRKDILRKLSYSFRPSKAKDLPSDVKEGQTLAPIKPSNLMDHSIYLGGIGEGAWYTLLDASEETVSIARHYSDGLLEFENTYRFEKEWFEQMNNNKVEIVHDSHFAWTTFRDKESGKLKRFYAR